MHLRRWTAAACLLAAACGGRFPREEGAKVARQPVELVYAAIDTSENAEINPFRDVRLTVTFRREDDRSTYTIPGFFAADGQSAETSASSGDRWIVRFTPPKPGRWIYTTSFRTGPDVALSLDRNAGEPAAVDGVSGDFDVAPAPDDAPGFYRTGVLRHAGGFHLRFENGDYFLKGGADSPENFLGYADFDDTFDTAAHDRVATDQESFIHRYEPHLQDARDDDPTWQDGKGKAILGALNYLASKGMNSVYMLTYNLDGGDGKDVWPWTSPDVRDRFDVSKLEQWERVFTHMDRLGLAMHVVLHETENDEELGGGPDLNPVRKLYLRELIARFAHHPALIWNLGEENDMPDADRVEIARWIDQLDAYDHPVTVHTHNRQALTFYDGLLGSTEFDATSIQGDMEAVNREAVALRVKTREAGRPWAIFHDEQAPAEVGAAPDADDPAHNLPRKYALWGNLMGGGSGVEWYFGYSYPNMDLNAEDWRSRDALWDQTRHALEFFREHLPYWEMWPANELAQDRRAYVLADEGRIYAVYLPHGGETKVALPDGEFTVRWYDPRNGGGLQTGTVAEVPGGKPPIGLPPTTPESAQGRDWVALIRRK